MSANNQLVILPDFTVLDIDVDETGEYKVGQGKTLDEALDICDTYMETNEVEYGLRIIRKKV